MQEDFTPRFPTEIIYQRTIAFPVPQWRFPFFRRGHLWISVPRKYFRKRVAVFADTRRTNLDDILIGMAQSNGAWVLNDGRIAFRIKTY